MVHGSKEAPESLLSCELRIKSMSQKLKRMDTFLLKNTQNSHLVALWNLTFLLVVFSAFFLFGSQISSHLVKKPIFIFFCVCLYAFFPSCFYFQHQRMLFVRDGHLECVLNKKKGGTHYFIISVLIRTYAKLW